MHLLAQNVLFGVLSKRCPLSNLLNHSILIGKLLLWDCGRSQTLPKFQGLQSKPKIRHETEKTTSLKLKEMGTIAFVYLNMHVSFMLLLIQF